MSLLEDNIRQANWDLAVSQDQIDGFLLPTIAKYEQKMSNVKQNIENNRKAL